MKGLEACRIAATASLWHPWASEKSEPGIERGRLFCKTTMSVLSTCIWQLGNMTVPKIQQNRSTSLGDTIIFVLRINMRTSRQKASRSQRYPCPAISGRAKARCSQGNGPNREWCPVEHGKIPSISLSVPPSIYLSIDPWNGLNQPADSLSQLLNSLLEAQTSLLAAWASLSQPLSSLSQPSSSLILPLSSLS